MATALGKRRKSGWLGSRSVSARPAAKKILLLTSAQRKNKCSYVPQNLHVTFVARLLLKHPAILCSWLIFPSVLSATSLCSLFSYLFFSFISSSNVFLCILVQRCSCQLTPPSLSKTLIQRLNDNFHHLHWIPPPGNGRSCHVPHHSGTFLNIHKVHVPDSWPLLLFTAHLVWTKVWNWQKVRI